MAKPTVDIYQSALAVTAARRAALFGLLNDTERARAERIRIPRAADQFVVARGLLRTMLGERLGIEPRAVELVLGHHGKPHLRDTDHPLRFNLSHSHGQVIFAFAESVEVGIDIEQQRPQVQYENLAKRYFSPRETAKLMALPEGERCAAFFRCWTRKEAFIKAKGDGLHLPLDQFDVAFAPDEPPALLYTKWDESEASRWQLHNLNAANGYAAALVTSAAVALRMRGG